MLEEVKEINLALKEIGYKNCFLFAELETTQILKEDHKLAHFIVRQPEANKISLKAYRNLQKTSYSGAFN